MVRASRTWVRVIGLAVMLGATGEAAAQDPSRGEVTIAGQRVVLAPAVGLLDEARSRVAIAFYATPIPAVVESANRRAGQWNPSASLPSVVVDLEFTPGSTSGMVQQLRSCRARFTGFRAPLELSGGATECHLISVGGMLRAPGGMAGVMQGQGANYSIRLPFSLSFAGDGAAPAPQTTSAPAPAPRPAAATAVAAAPIAANTATGTAVFEGQTLKITHGLAWYEAEDSDVELAFFDHVPSARMLADLRSGSWGEGGPTVLATLRFDRGKPPSAATVTYCYVNPIFPGGRSMAYNGDARRCGLADLTTTAQPGGTVTARLKGTWPGAGGKPFSWDLAFNLPIAK